MKKLNIIPIFILFFISNTYCQNIKNDIDSLFYAKKNSISVLKPNIGISIGIIKNNNTFYYSCGKLNHDSSEKTNENTIFEIGSVTKIFTGLLIANEIEKNKLKINDYIETYLPKDIVNKNIRNKVTIKNLLSYTSGLPTFHGDKYDIQMNKIDSVQPYKLVTKKQLLKVLTENDSLGKQEYEYSNYNFALLGFILNNLEHQKYENLIKKRIFEPLMMNNSYCNKFPNNNIAGLYDENDISTNNIILGEFEPAGIIKSNIVDMSKFIYNQIYNNNSKLQKSINLSQKILYENTELNTAFGWHIFKIKDNEVYYMQGDTFGNSSIIGFDKKNKIGIVILANQQSHDFLEQIFDYVYKNTLK